MENTIRRDAPIENKEDQKTAEVKDTPKKQKFHFPIKLLVIGGVFLLVIAIIGIILLAVGGRNVANTKILPTPTVATQLSLTPTPSIIDSLLPQKIGIYTLSGNTLQNTTTLLPENNVNFSVSTPSLDSSGYVYYIDQNKVIQLSLTTQAKKEIYTNSNLYTKIANLTFVAPSILYVSIIFDPLDPNYNTIPDHSSLVVEVNIATNEVRTIGPLVTITHGYINYLFKSQDNDVLNAIEKNYCRGDGSIFAVGSGSAKFITKDGFGCNGSDPYLLGQIESANQLVFAQPDSVKTDDFVTRYSTIYATDIFSHAKTNLFDASILYSENKNTVVGETNFALSDDKKFIFAVIGSKVFSIDIGTRKVVKTFDLATVNIDISKYSIITIANNTIYLLSASSKNLVAFDLVKSTITVYPQTIITDPAHISTFTYLGKWNNQPVFSVAL